MKTAENKGTATSEFYLSLAATLIGALLASGLLPEAHLSVKILGILSATLSAFGYTYGRSRLKATSIEMQSKKEALLLGLGEALPVPLKKPQQQ